MIPAHNSGAAFRSSNPVAGKRRLNSAASSVPDDDTKRRLELLYGIFDGSDLVTIGDVSGHPDGEEVADTLIKNDFRNDARV